MSEIKTVGDLIKALSKIDPDTRVALESSGGLITPVDKLHEDDFFIASTDRTFATYGAMMDSAFQRYKGLSHEGRVLVIMKTL